MPHFPRSRREVFFRQPGGFEPRKRQMRRKNAASRPGCRVFPWPYRYRPPEFSGSVKPRCPPRTHEDVSRWGKKTKSAKIERDRLLGGARRRARAANGRESCFSHLTNEFERHVNILRTRPASLRRNCAKGLDQCREIFPHRRGNLQRNEQTHRRSAPFWRCALAALRRCRGNGCALDRAPIGRHTSGIASRSPGKSTPRLFHAAGMRQRDMYGAHRLFLAAAARPRDAGDAHAQRAAGRGGEYPRPTRSPLHC